ncbi:unnamed protein product, partial [Mesorhabditis spiculigera]
MEARVDAFRLLYEQKVSADEEFPVLYNILVPEVFCPSAVRVGQILDGGKWACRPWAVPKNCAVYSLGIDNDTTFERDFQRISAQQCRIYAYDMKRPMFPEVLEGLEKLDIHFREAKIGLRDSKVENTVSLENEMKRHHHGQIEVLKMDIEGAEFQVLPPLVERIRICQILIELHGLPPKVVGLLMTLGDRGYRLFSHELTGYYLDRISEKYRQ